MRRAGRHIEQKPLERHGVHAMQRATEPVVHLVYGRYPIYPAWTRDFLRPAKLVLPAELRRFYDIAYFYHASISTVRPALATFFLSVAFVCCALYRLAMPTPGRIMALPKSSVCTIQSVSSVW